MAYHFQGVFIGNCIKTPAELETLFGGRARAIQTPFVGVVISFETTHAYWDWDETQHEAMKAQILKFSVEIPEALIAYIDYSTWGGAIEYVAGFACRNGAVIEGSEQEGEEKAGNKVFLFLLEIMGAKSPELYFEPFTGHFFPKR